MHLISCRVGERCLEEVGLLDDRTSLMKTQTVVGATPLLQWFKSPLSRTIVRRHTRENRPNVDMLVVA
jgi:hypothetical protein